MFTMDNTSGYTTEQISRLNALLEEELRGVDRGSFDWSEEVQRAGERAERRLELESVR